MHQEEILQAVTDVVNSGWYLRGEVTRQFEEDYARYIGTRYCVGCGNGLDALRLIWRAYLQLGRIRKGDEVIVPANTYIASILSITDSGLKPVLVEPDLKTLEIDDRLIEQAITPRTRAVLLVHLYGRNAWTPHVAELCRNHHLLLVEDNAQAHGCKVKVNGTFRHTGALGDAAAHSFYPGKNLGALGDAGAVTTNDVSLAKMVRALGNYGSSEKYVFPYQGLNSRIDEIQAAVLKVKLNYLDEENEKRRNIAHYYNEKIAGSCICRNNGSIKMLLPYSDDEKGNVFHIFPLLTPHRDFIRKYLAERGIGTAIHYPIPPHHQACYSAWNSLELPVTEKIHREELSLPCNQTMTDAEVEIVAETVAKAFRTLEQ
ncbi:MAG: DegT/DnrJ/EryC1/StrS family aminotransferase [Prevotella sp.]